MVRFWSQNPSRKDWNSDIICDSSIWAVHVSHRRLTFHLNHMYRRPFLSIPFQHDMMSSSKNKNRCWWRLPSQWRRFHSQTPRRYRSPRCVCGNRSCLRGERDLLRLDERGWCRRSGTQRWRGCRVRWFLLGRRWRSCGSWDFGRYGLWFPVNYFHLDPDSVSAERYRFDSNYDYNGVGSRILHVIYWSNEMVIGGDDIGDEALDHYMFGDDLCFNEIFKVTCTQTVRIRFSTTRTDRLSSS